MASFQMCVVKLAPLSLVRPASSMKLSNPLQWWQRLSRRRRIAIIAGLLLLLAGPEMVAYLAPVFDIAVLIDAFGVAFLLSTAMSCCPVPLRSLWGKVGMLTGRAQGWALEGIARVRAALELRRGAISYHALSIEHKMVWGGIFFVYSGSLLVIICLGSACVHVLARALRAT
jgi:hypothetical protein